jgi:hypothetical protein
VYCPGFIKLRAYLHELDWLYILNELLSANTTSEELVALHIIRCRIKFLISQNATSFGTNFDPCIKTVLTLAILLRRTMPNMCNLCDEFVLGYGPILHAKTYCFPYALVCAC